MKTYWRGDRVRAVEEISRIGTEGQVPMGALGTVTKNSPSDLVLVAVRWDGEKGSWHVPKPQIEPA